MYTHAQSILQFMQRLFDQCHGDVPFRDIVCSMHEYISCPGRALARTLVVASFAQALVYGCKDNPHKPKAYRRDLACAHTIACPTQESDVLKPEFYVSVCFRRHSEHFLRESAVRVCLLACRAEALAAFRVSEPRRVLHNARPFSFGDIVHARRSRQEDASHLTFLWTSANADFLARVFNGECAHDNLVGALLNHEREDVSRVMERIMHGDDGEAAMAAASIVYIDTLCSSALPARFVLRRCVCSLLFPWHAKKFFHHIFDYWQRRPDNRVPIIVHADAAEFYLCRNAHELDGPLPPQDALRLWVRYVMEGTVGVGMQVRNALSSKVTREWVTDEQTSKLLAPSSSFP